MNGAPFELVRRLDIGELLVDATHVYWVGNDGLVSVETTGGVARALSDEDMRLDIRKRMGWAFPSIAMDETHVFYSNDKVVRSVAKAGGRPRALHHGRVGLEVVGVDEREVFVLEHTQMGGSEGADFAQTLVAIPKAGGSVRTVASKLPNVQWLSADGDALLWLSWTRPAQYGYKYAALLRMPKAGGAQERLAEIPPTLYPGAASAPTRRRSTGWSGAVAMGLSCAASRSAEVRRARSRASPTHRTWLSTGAT